jgi:hypothetical protein
VERETAQAKFWLTPVSLSGSSGFAAHELNKIEGIVMKNQQAFLEKWNEYFNQ